MNHESWIVNLVERAIQDLSKSRIVNRESGIWIDLKLNRYTKRVSR